MTNPDDIFRVYYLIFFAFAYFSYFFILWLMSCKWTTKAKRHYVLFRIAAWNTWVFDINFMVMWIILQIFIVCEHDYLIPDITDLLGGTDNFLILVIVQIFITYGYYLIRRVGRFRSFFKKLEDKLKPSKDDEEEDD